MATLVVVSADWCSPCKALKKALKAKGIEFAIVDIDAPSGARLADKLGVASIPAVFVKNGADYVRVREPSISAIRAAIRRHGA